MRRNIPTDQATTMEYMAHVVQAGRCYYCGIDLSFEDDHFTSLSSPLFPKGSFRDYWNVPTYATIDHMIPLSRGGNDTLDNIVIACRDCNERKQTQTATEFTLAESIR